MKQEEKVFILRQEHTGQLEDQRIAFKDMGTLARVTLQRIPWVIGYDAYYIVEGSDLAGQVQL